MKWAIKPWKDTEWFYYQVKEANLKDHSTVWMQLYDILEKAEL